MRRLAQFTRRLGLPHDDVLIVTHRDQVAGARQPLYLARAATTAGLRTTLICTAPRSVRTEIAHDGFRVLSTSSLPGRGRATFVWLYMLVFICALRAKVVVNFDLSNLAPVAWAARFGRFALVLYWLEAVYGDDGSPTSITTRLGRNALSSVMPPAALVDVNVERLRLSWELCGEPAATFVLRNAPPLHAWNVGIPHRRDGRPRLVYAGSVTGAGAEGVELLLKAVGASKTDCSLTIIAAEGLAACERLRRIVLEQGLEEQVSIRDRVRHSELPHVLAEYDVGLALYPVRPGQHINSTLAAPSKLYEYLASGLAVIASNNETLQFVSSEGLGWNLSEPSVKDTCRVLREAENRELVDRFRLRARAAFVSRYNYETDLPPFIDWLKAATGVHEQSAVLLLDQ